MPQERLRSVVYRSFVTCEDPRGVVEGKTIRISKSDTTKTGSQRTDTQLKNSKEKEKMSSSKNPSSYELVEVKNGAQKLNEAIDSWSKCANYKSQPKDIAKDLLKGALDLQESLLMLGKLQEASCMAKLKKKQEKSSEGLGSRNNSDRFESFRSYDNMGFEKQTNLANDRFESFRSYDNMGFEKQTNLANGPSKDCYTELRDVIRDGLSKQNLLPNKSFQESAFSGIEDHAGKKKLQLSLDMASTSSSRSSSMVYSTHEFTSSESYSSRATEEKSKGSNLIARLMGLEEFPSKAPHSTPINRLRPVFDVDLPYAKKVEFFVDKKDREHMTLDEIIKMMQSKGLLRSNKREIRPKRFEDDVPPIVLMKPQKVKANGSANSNTNSNLIRKLHQEKAKAEEKAIKTRDKSPSSKQKVSVPHVIKPERKQEMEKKIDKIQKMAPPLKKKPVENAKVTNPVSKNSTLKQVKTQKNALPNPNTKRLSSSSLSSTKSSNQKKNVKIEKTVNDPLTTIVHEVLQVDSPSEHQSEESEVADVSHIKDPKVGVLKTISSSQDSTILETVSTFQDSEILETVCSSQDPEVLETANSSQDSEILKTVNSSQDFEILKIISSFRDSEPTNSGLLQDCINEFLEHENRRKKTFFTSRNCGCEDKLMSEIAKEVEILRNYNKFPNESSNGDTIHGFLEKDLCLSKMGGTWSSGWKDGCTLDEVEEAVLDLEKMVLSKLIDDMLIELVL